MHPACDEEMTEAEKGEFMIIVSHAFWFCYCWGRGVETYRRANGGEVCDCTGGVLMGGDP